MLYYIIRPFVRLTFRIFFSKIHLHHLDRIPMDRPVLIASNHPSAFLEACLLATHFPKSLHFLVRGDIFVNKFVIWILAQLHLTPIYRFVDGFKNLRANENTFNECYERLAAGEIIVVYAEGNTTQEKRLRPIQKGLAKLAFGALDTYPDLDLCVVPLGINYTHPNDFRSEIFVEAGIPIELKTFFQKYKSESQKAINELTKEVEYKMKPLVIHIDKNEDLPLAEKLWLLTKSASHEKFWPVVDRTGERYAIDKKVSEMVNRLDPQQKMDLDHQIKPSPGQPTRSIFMNILSIPAYIGKVINYFPFWVANKISQSLVKRIEFFASVLVGTGMFLYIFYLIALTLLSLWLGVSVIITISTVILLGLIYLYHDHLIKQAELAAISKLNADLIHQIFKKKI